MIQLISNFRTASLKVQALTSFFSMGFYLLTSHILESSYLKSRFPVPYFIQQTSFNATKMKNWYSYMIQEGTFSIYFKTQIIDFFFITAVILAGFTLFTFISNLQKEDSVFRKWGSLFAFSLPLAGIFDSLENFISFFMIANPTEFPNSLIIPYSSFASIKFGFWTIGLLWLSISILNLLFSKIIHKRLIVASSIFFLGLNSSNAQELTATKSNKRLIYIEADPFAYINKGYSVHLGYENWGFRFDLTKVKVDFPASFEKEFYHTKAFDLVSNINGIKIDYIGKRTNWSKGAFVGLDVNAQKLSFMHRQTEHKTYLKAFNVGVRAGYKINIYKGFYITPWAALWKNVIPQQSFQVGNDQIKTNKWDWITTLHFGYAFKF